jgi:hypothetical protein
MGARPSRVWSWQLLPARSGGQVMRPVQRVRRERDSLADRGELGERAVRHDLHLDALLVRVLDVAWSEGCSSTRMIFMLASE